MSLERAWKEMVQNLRSRGQDSSYHWIMADRRIVNLYNSGTDNENQHIGFVTHVTADNVDG